MKQNSRLDEWFSLREQRQFALTEMVQSEGTWWVRRFRSQGLGTRLFMSALRINSNYNQWASIATLVSEFSSFPDPIE